MLQLFPMHVQYQFSAKSVDPLLFKNNGGKITKIGIYNKMGFETEKQRHKCVYNMLKISFTIWLEMTIGYLNFHIQNL